MPSFYFIYNFLQFLKIFKYAGIFINVNFTLINVKFPENFPRLFLQTGDFPRLQSQMQKFNTLEKKHFPNLCHDFIEILF